MVKNRAFTLIELLVVIAIIAILAAILFPVFAQAKASAKKTADLSSIKQTALGVHMYMADNDDTMPQAVATDPSSGAWLWWAYIDVPARWRPGLPEGVYGAFEASWPNNVMPYVKNLNLYESAAGIDSQPYTAATYATALTKYAKMNFTFNGLLTSYNGTAIAEPTKLAVITQANGRKNIVGAAIVNPILDCNTANTACRFVPSSAGCSGANGTWSEMWVDQNTPQPVHTGGQVWAYADGSAKWKPIAEGRNNYTNYKTDPYFNYNSIDAPRNQWQDTNFCHALLFQPNFDFANWGSPVAW